jgi:hypothetical protein
MSEYDNCYLTVSGWMGHYNLINPSEERYQVIIRLWDVETGQFTKTLSLLVRGEYADEMGSEALEDAVDTALQVVTDYDKHWWIASDKGKAQEWKELLQSNELVLRRNNLRKAIARKQQTLSGLEGALLQVESEVAQ